MSLSGGNSVITMSDHDPIGSYGSEFCGELEYRARRRARVRVILGTVAGMSLTVASEIPYTQKTLEPILGLVHKLYHTPCHSTGVAAKSKCVMCDMGPKCTEPPRKSV